MPSLARRLGLLQGEPRPSVSAILAGALPWAEPRELEALAAAAVRTRRPEAIAAVIGVLDRLAPATMTALAGLTAPVGAALELLRTPREQLNGIALARRRGEPELTGHLVRYLRTSDDEVPRRAAGALLDIVTRHAGDDGRRRMDERTAGLIDAAVAEATSAADRRQDDVFIAAAVLSARPGVRLANVLDDPRHPVLFSIRRVVGRTDHRLVRHNLLRWLTTEAIGGQAARSLHRVRGAREYAEVLEVGHLLLQPLRRRAMRRVDRAARCLPDLVTAQMLPEAAQVNLVRLVRTLTTGSLRRQRLADYATLPAPAARLQAVLTLLGDETTDATRAIATSCVDPDEAVACLAAGRVLVSREPPGRELLRRLESSPHPLIARRAIALAAAAGVDAFFERWLELGTDVGGWVGRQLLRTHRATLLGRLRTAVTRGGRDEKLAAISLARRLGVVRDLEIALIDQAAVGDARVASAAVAALPDGDGSRHSRQALEAALGHDDARVRANALEALMRCDRRAIDRLTDLLDSRDNRLRANAVRAVLRRRGKAGPASLRDMLGDADPLHRVSSIWVAARTREGRVAGELREMADHDELAEVRRRAAAAIRWIRP